MVVENTVTKVTKYKPISDLANWVQALFFISGLAAVVSILSGLMQSKLLNDALNGKYISLAKATANDNREALIGWVQVGFLLIAAILFLVWVHRANKNLHAFKNPALRFSPGWAVGWFFIPIMWLFRPYQVVNEISKASNPDIDPAVNNVNNLPAPAIVAVWWAFFLISNYIGWFAFRYFLQDDTVSDLLNSTYAYMVDDAVNVVGFIITIFLVRTISQSQDKRYQKTIELIKQEVPNGQ
jgi:hypothetical protein